MGLLISTAIRLALAPAAIGLSFLADALLGAEECPYCGRSIDTCQKILK
jgi:hypothetical protein